MSAARIEVRGARQSDIDIFYPNGLGVTSRAWVGIVDGELYCIGGLSFHRHMTMCFTATLPGVKVGRKVKYLLACVIWAKIRALGYDTIYAIATPGMDTAESFIRHFGFEHHSSGPQGEVFKCQLQQFRQY